MLFDLYAPVTLVTLHFASEFFVMRYKRPAQYSDNRDKGSLPALIFAFLLGLGLARLAKLTFPQGQMESLLQMAPIGVLLCFAGTLLRWVSIVQLGRFFTVEVVICKDHQLIDTGPYRLLRHPSYTGPLLVLLGVGICSGNVLALLVIALPFFVAVQHRIAIEEIALSDAFGERYAAYQRKTKRLIPFVY